MNLKFGNFDTLAQKLEELPSFHRIAFAASICERLLPTYNAFFRESGWGNFTVLRTALDEVWLSLARKQFDKTKILQLIKDCEATLPHADDVDSRYTYEAQDAVAAICYLLEAGLTPASWRVVKVAQRATDTIKEFIEYEEEDRDPNWYKKLEEPSVTFASHPLAVREMAKQQEDLQRLKEVETLEQDFLEWLRTSYNNDGKSVIDVS